MPADCIKHLVDNPPMLRQVLLFHVAQGSWFSAGLEDGMSLESLQTSKLSIGIQDGKTTKMCVQIITNLMTFATNQ
jgi:uncharacterized surface protein with fasciclin (FAS1) repeats